MDSLPYLGNHANRPQNPPHHAPFGYPTPPTSPAYDNPECHFQPPHANRYYATSYASVAPAARLGTLLQGKLELTDILGTGAYGVVYLAVDINTGIRYAVKCLSKYAADGSPLERRQVAYQQREISLHYKVSAHPNVITMHKIVDDMDCIYVILEYCPEGDLFLNITERGQYVGKDELSKKIFLQILDAVEHCHSLGIYHRDLKPENILVTDQGNTVKLADFGLATSDDRSEDYGCGSTFYMSPECLEPSARNLYYMCAPNDVWSLGVILVNLTCGRNPWKQASFQDSTYRAYARSPDFLKTILPLTDDFNAILGRIFDPNPLQRIGLRDLRTAILACSKFTVPAVSTSAGPVPETAPAVHYATPQVEYLDYPCEDAITDDCGYDAPLSPVSTVSDEGSLTSSGSTIDDCDEDFFQEQQADPSLECVPHNFESEDLGNHGFHTQEFVPQHYNGPVPVQAPLPLGGHSQQLASILCPRLPIVPPAAPCLAHIPAAASIQVHAPCQQAKAYFPLWDVIKYVQQVPVMPQQVPFHNHAHFIPSFQGCY